MALVQLGGLGISTGTAIIAIVVFRRLGLRARLYTSTESGNVAIGEVGRIVRGRGDPDVQRRGRRRGGAHAAVVARATTTRFGEAAWLGVFHSVTAFNNAGFALFSDSSMGFAADPLHPAAGPARHHPRRHRRPGALRAHRADGRDSWACTRG